jgi:hypothetical protein
MTGTDTYLGEPMINIPTVWGYSGSGVQTHHNSEDTPERVDPRSLRDITVVNAAFLYYLANAGAPEAIWLAELSQTRGYEQMLHTIAPFLDRIASAKDSQNLGELLASALEHISYSVNRESVAVSSVQRLAPEVESERVRAMTSPMVESLRRFGEEQAARVRSAVQARGGVLGLSETIQSVAAPMAQSEAASRIVVRRKRFGSLPLDDLPPDQREGYPSGAWDPIPTIALYWCDGNRNLAEVIHLTRMELGPTDFDFLGYFRFLRQHGYVDLVRE